MSVSNDTYSLIECTPLPHIGPRWTFSQIVQGYMSCACILLGTIGNACAIRSIHATNLDKNRGVNLAVSVMFLAVWDTFLLWSALFYYVLKNIPVPIDADTAHVLTRWFHGLTHITNNASTWMVVAITVQRYMATRDPFRSTRTAVAVHSFRSDRRISSLSFVYCSNYRRLFRMPLAVSFFAVFLNIPAFFELALQACMRQDGSEGWELVVTRLRKNNMYKMYRTILRMVFTSIGPNAFIFVVSGFTVFYLRGSNRSRRKLFQWPENLLERFTSRENIQTLLSIMLVAKFLVFRSLTFGLDMMEHFMALNNFIYLIDISNFLILLNSATNCLIFIKGASWLNSKIIDRKTMKRKKTVCDSGQMSLDRLSVLARSWQAAQAMTGGQIGLRVLYSMLRKHPALFDVFRQQSAECDAEMTALLACPRRSFDLITNTKYQEVADRITSFIGEIIAAMQEGQSEQLIIARIRRVGSVHLHHRVIINGAVWKEFKSATLGIIAECEFGSEEERLAALDVWGTFIAFLIREMKMGTWIHVDNLHSIPSHA